MYHKFSPTDDVTYYYSKGQSIQVAYIFLYRAVHLFSRFGDKLYIYIGRGISGVYHGFSHNNGYVVAMTTVVNVVTVETMVPMVTLI